MTTIKEIAEQANVSIGTVDRVIHGRGRVSPETAEKVRKLIHKKGYKPNLYARNLKLSRSFHFGVLMPEEDQDGGYWAQPATGMRKALSELHPHRVTGDFFYYDKYSNHSLAKIKQAVQDADLQGLLIAPIFTNPLIKLIDSLSGQLPYVFFDSDLPDLQPITVINQDAYQSGRLAAELIQKIIQSPGPLLVVKIIPDDYHISARVRGFLEYFKDLNEFDVSVHEANVGADPDCILPLIDHFKKQHSNLKGIFVTNALTYQVAQAVQTLSLNPKPVLIGYDLIESNAVWLKKGVIDFVISQQPNMQGYQGIYSLYRSVILQEEVEKKMVIPLDIISKENMIYHYPYKNNG